MFETLGPAPRDHRGRERLRLPRGVEGARAVRRATCRTRAAPILETVEAENRVAILHARAALPLGPGAQPRHPRGVPGARATRCSRSARSRKDETYLDALLQGRARSAAHAPARHQRRVAGELLGQQRAEGVGGEVRRAAPERRRCWTCRASSAATTRRPTASSTSIVSASATPYAALHDIDANKPGGSIKIRVKTYAHSLKLHEERARGRRRRASRTCCTRSTRSGSRCSSSRPSSSRRARTSTARSRSGSTTSWRACAPTKRSTRDLRTPSERRRRARISVAWAS